uniref:Uncharacterized protein n=1 Tax=Arundo donax TaxID=35708 RepID=A0A0A9G0K2_ARUDO
MSNLSPEPVYMLRYIGNICALI